MTMTMTTTNSVTSRAAIASSAPIESPSPSSPTAATNGLVSAPKHVDIGEAIARMVIESAFSRRAQARDDRKQATESMVQSQQRQITALRAEAEERFVQARTAAIGKGLEGGARIAGGVITISGATASDSTSKALKGWAEGTSASGSVVASGFDLFAGDHGRDADRAGIRAKTHGMASEAASKQINGAEDEIAEAREHAKKAIEFLKEFNATQHRATSAAIRG